MDFVNIFKFSALQSILLNETWTENLFGNRFFYLFITISIFIIIMQPVCLAAIENISRNTEKESL